MMSAVKETLKENTPSAESPSWYQQHPF
jgi:hypothetical protein